MASPVTNHFERIFQYFVGLQHWDSLKTSNRVIFRLFGGHCFWFSQCRVSCDVPAILRINGQPQRLRVTMCRPNNSCQIIEKWMKRTCWDSQLWRKINQRFNTEEFRKKSWKSARMCQRKNKNERMEGSDGKYERGLLIGCRSWESQSIIGHGPESIPGK